MITLTKENITDYLKTKMPDMDYSRPLIISEIGEGTAEEDGDGYVNFVYRVSDGNRKLILKQARKEGRGGNFDNLPMGRAALEYDYMKIMQVIIPEYIPKLYFYDEENLVFAVEDISYLKIARFQMNKSITFPKMAKQLGEYLAKTHFYTSDYYLDTETFRKLQVRFMNSKMRMFFEEQTFLNRDLGEPGENGFELDPEYAAYIRDLILDPQVALERRKLRDIYMHKAEALIHGDLHTSNFFVSQDQMKAIDMEISCMGPVAFDLGYLQSHLLSQFACSVFRPFDSEEQHLTFIRFILSAMEEVFTEYFRVFFQCWHQDAKPIYQGIPGLQEYIQAQVRKDMIGFCSSMNIFRCASTIHYPEYDDLTDKEAKRNATLLSMLLDHRMILRREDYQSVSEWIDDIASVTKTFLSQIHKP